MDVQEEFISRLRFAMEPGYMSREVVGIRYFFFKNQADMFVSAINTKLAQIIVITGMRIKSTWDKDKEISNDWNYDAYWEVLSYNVHVRLLKKFLFVKVNLSFLPIIWT